MNAAPDWKAVSGDAWARRWRDTDRALSAIAVELDAAILVAAPHGPFRAFDIGCGPGSTSLALAQKRPDADITACDLSPSLARIAQERAAGQPSVRVILGDAEEVAEREGPFDLLYSRHGVMFFDDPARAFRTLRSAASDGAAILFSCFQDWEANPWASELASAAAGRTLPPPGREPSGFAFAEPNYVREIFGASGWAEPELRSVQFAYLAGEGSGAIDEAVDFLSEIGPASRAVESLPDEERPAALQRMREVIERHFNGRAVEFGAAAWIWTARARGEPR